MRIIQAKTQGPSVQPVYDHVGHYTGVTNSLIQLLEIRTKPVVISCIGLGH